MAEGSAGATLGKVVLGGGVGFALYLLVTGLGFGGRGEASAASRPKDDKRLSFLMIEPKIPGRPAGFRLQGDDPTKTYSIDDLVARVKEGGRTDVELRASGDVIQGPWNEARDLIKRAGLTVWIAETSGAPSRVGFSCRENARGQYGWHDHGGLRGRRSW